GGAAGWLTPETSNGTVTNAAGQSGSSGNTGNVTFAISPSAAGMASGTYTADVQLIGTSPYCGQGYECSSQKVTVTLTVGGGTGCTGSGCGGTPTSTNPTSTEPTNPTSTGPTNPTSTSPVDQPSCTLSAVPSSIIVPQPATLKYSCVKVSSCTLSGGGFGTSSIVSVAGDNTAKGSTTDAPTANTFYTISCYGTGSYSSATATAQVQVSVTNPGRNETNP
ncbi:MAG: hypothetical protein P4L67_02820, partial [Candidatus Pacebacteria bacterium]|nr:hypothetical protein [Candidatus Paceibacterota bacterium]